MGNTESNTVTEGHPPESNMDSHLVRRGNNIDRPFLAPSFADFTPRTLYKVECPISIDSKSIKLVQSPTFSDKFALCFEGKCLKPSKLQIFSFVKEVSDEVLFPKELVLLPTKSSEVRESPPLIPISAGGDFRFNGWESNTAIFSIADIEAHVNNLKDTWSCIIRLSLDEPNPTMVEMIQVYCAMKMVSSEPKVKVITKKCVFQKRGSFMCDLYGLGDMSKSEGEGKECVICMSNNRDTCVMPCRHVCCCAECANTLRLQSDRCPVCRELISELIYLTVNPDYLNKQKDEEGRTNVELQTLFLVSSNKQLNNNNIRNVYQMFSKLVN